LPWGREKEKKEKEEELYLQMRWQVACAIFFFSGGKGRAI
jgi:hypothetical protein